MARDASTPQAPPGVERFLKQLVVTFKAVMLYPTSSNIPRENASSTIACLRAMLASSPEMRLVVSKECVFVDSIPVFPGEPAYTAFSQELYGHNLSEVRFHSGTSERDVLAFLGLLRLAPEEIVASGGFEARLWEQQVDGITVKEASVKIVDASPAKTAGGPKEPPPGEQWPPPGSRIDEMLVGAFGGRPRDQRMLVRVIQDPKVVTGYLKESLAGRGARPEDAWTASQLSSLARAVRQELPTDQPELFRSLAEAVMGLDPQLRRMLMRDKLLTEARTDEGLAEVVRQLSVEEVCKVLVDSLSEGEISEEGLSRAIRNLAIISYSDRDEVVQTAGSVMRGSNVSEETVGNVLAGAAPSRIEVRERKQTEEAEPLERVLRLVDLAPSSRPLKAETDPSLRALHVEARRGITDGDVTAALVSLVSQDPRPGPFATTMAMLEDTLGLLIERGDYEVAADAAEGLNSALGDMRLSEEQRNRIQLALDTMATPKQMHAMTKALRMFPKESWEYASCRKLLGVLGGHALRPLLEVLADESDMSARKSIVDLIAELAPTHIPELGATLGDTRWFFVRNVVSILGRTHSPQALPFLERTIRYGDARVRRETVRAVAGIKDRLAEQILAAALDDEDAQNVQLAARFLAQANARGSVKALEQVARGEGRGNREIGSRVEAIEALGALKAVEAVPTLRAVAGKRGLFGGNRGREVRAAAEAALKVLSAKDGGGDS